MRLALYFQRATEPDRSHANSQPSKLIRHTDQILQPAPQRSSTDKTRAKTQPANGTGCQDRDPGDAIPVQLPEELRRVLVHGQRVQESCASE